MFRADLEEALDGDPVLVGLAMNEEAAHNAYVLYLDDCAASRR